MGSPNSSSLSSKEEALFSFNVKQHLSYDLAKQAFTEIINEKDVATRERFLLQTLSCLMVIGPSLTEITGFLDAIFEYDNYHSQTRPFFPSTKPTITVAGSGKKGLKTVNLSSLSSFVAACSDINVLKSCAPATSSSTGSQDFISLLSGVNNWLDLDMESIVKDLGIGFFSVEAVFPRFASFYTGTFYTPHALSFALAGMASKYRTDSLLYGLAHPNIGLGVEVFRYYGIPRASIVTSTFDDLHYIDEAISSGASFINGYLDPSDKVKKNQKIIVKNITGNNSPEEVMISISQEKEPFHNLVKGLSGLVGSNPVLEKQIALNAAIILLTAKGGNLTKRYDECLQIIKSGVPIDKIKLFITHLGGNPQKFLQLVSKAKLWHS